MSFWTAIVIIVLIASVASIMRSRNNASNGITEDYLGNQSYSRTDDPEREAREREMGEEIAQLKERIAVLERIATDTNSNTARERARLTAEIEALRGTGSESGVPLPETEDQSAKAQSEQAQSEQARSD
jgi:hypothetical protein